jgi:hypothetical protein
MEKSTARSTIGHKKRTLEQKYTKRTKLGQLKKKKAVGFFIMEKSIARSLAVFRLIPEQFQTNKVHNTNKVWGKRIPLRAWIFFYCVCCVLSGRGMCDELVTRPRGVLTTVACRVTRSQKKRAEPLGDACLKNQHSNLVQKKVAS